MGQRQSLTGWELVLLQTVSAFLAERNFRALPRLKQNRSSPSGGTLDHVSVVVPARNEAAHLVDLLQSLAELRGVQVDVTVVDDESTDATAEIARAAGARVITVSGPPAGWTGKTFACHTGAAATEGEWLLFTDADTVHHPDSLRRALAGARHFNAGLLSLLPAQRCETMWERLLLPYAYALYFVGAHRVNQPGGPTIANGQYLLFRRTDYNLLGGHAEVRASIIEDVDLARAARQRGIRVVLVRGEQDVSVRMYSNLSSLWEGFGKNSFRFVRASPRNGVLTVLAATALSASLPSALRGGPFLRRMAVLVVPALWLSVWLHRFGVPRRYALLHPLAAAVFQLIALDSIRRTFTPGQTVWKGRRY